MMEETDWEQCYIDGDTPWDQGSPSPVLVHYLDAQMLTGNVIAPGCGSGHDVAEIARRSDTVSVLGMDISSTAVGLANSRLAAFDNATCEHADLFDPGSHHVGQYDWVWEHTCFCAIDPTRRSDYVDAVHRLLKPEGKLLAVFYLEPKQREDGVAGPPFGCSIDELDALFEGRFMIEESRVPEVAYPGREGRELLRVLRRK
ncbi:MAG: methyltransferase domain-containing protein [Verrucomicrobiales bacterium]